MRLFLYGTLLDPATLAARGGDPALPSRCRDATLRGWRRVMVAGGRWPTLRRCAGESVAGKTLVASAAALRRLREYEGPAYSLRRIMLEPRTPAWTWIAPGGTTKAFPSGGSVMKHQRSCHDQL